MRRLRFSDGWLDFDLDLFADIAHPIDLKLDRFDHVAKADFSRADSLDIPLRYEHLLGVGFVAAQLYLVGVAEEGSATRRQALSIGPRHACGIALAELINDGANYWKHADEWDYDVADVRKDRILTAFARVGMADDEISLYGLLVQVTGSDQPRLLDLSPILEQWRDALEETFPTECGRSTP